MTKDEMLGGDVVETDQETIMRLQSELAFLRNDSSHVSQLMEATMQALEMPAEDLPNGPGLTMENLPGYAAGVLAMLKFTQKQLNAKRKR